jgi:hypothetical protein
MNTDDDNLINAVSNELYKRVGDASIFSLPWVPQVVTVVLGAQGVIDNGGFIYFFENDWRGNPPYSVFGDAYRAIGADESADCLEVAASLFPFSDPHLDLNARRRYLNEHCTIANRTNDSATLVKLGDRVIDHSTRNYSLLAQYIRQHLGEIRAE